MEYPNYLHFSDLPKETIRELIEKFQPDKVAILVDENTKEHCYPNLGVEGEVVEIKSGETNKTLETCQHIWKKLTENRFSRNSLLINLGGGVIGDMGGFCAATFKRGIHFINVPTTLLSMVDASIGGKLGIDFSGYKNHIGLFREPDGVIISEVFLKTLGERQMKSGYAEVMKHALIKDREHWNKVRNYQTSNLKKIIRKSVAIKLQVVTTDPKETGERKTLNFGHTLGHAIESHFLGTPDELLHGEAVAIGMLLEAHIGLQKELLKKEEFKAILDALQKIYAFPVLPDVSELIELCRQDKKNQGEQLNFSLINNIGHCLYDIPVNDKEIELAVARYHEIR